jgi:hypothetical protein
MNDYGRDEADAVSRGEHPNQLKGDLRLLKALEDLPLPLPEDVMEDDEEVNDADE